MRVRIGDGTRLFVDVDGAGLVPEGPTMRERHSVVLLHGGPGMDHSMFKVSAFESLRADAQLVYLDHRGQGRSDRGHASDWNLDQWADDVVELCDVLGISKPVVVGTSFGGAVAQRYLARHPRHAGAAVLAGTSPRLDLEVVGNAFARLGGEQAGATARRFLSGDAAAADDFNTLCMPLYATQPLDLEALGRIEMNPDVLAHFMHEWNTMDLRDGLDEVACPVAVLAGGRDPIAPPEAVTELAEALPTSTTDYRVEPDAGHFEICADSTANATRALITRSAS
jgi:pimeloyl-ACP methyl ester carboxylesterase